MADIVPAILTDQYEVLEKRVRCAEGFAPLLHIDITDGRFVPTQSINALDLRKVQSTIPFELHMMVDRPENILEDYLGCGATRIILHRSSTDEGEELFVRIREAGCEAALAVSPATVTIDISSYLPLLHQITFVAVQLGFQGGALIPGVLQKARAFRLEHPEIPMEVDGGIKEANFSQILQTGADRYVLGSALWKTPDPAATYQRCKMIMDTTLNGGTV